MKSIALLLLLAPVVTPVLAADWGAYPDCNAPATPIEIHSWWQEPGEQHPRHIHLAACIPNARDTTGQAVSFSGRQAFTSRIMAFNNPGRLNFIRQAWGSDVTQIVKKSDVCQASPDMLRECTWWDSNLVLDATTASNAGLQELRLTPDVRHNDLGTRQFATLNYQVYLKNGKTVKNYRRGPAPIGRSWYTGFDYVNVEVENYMALFTNVNQAIPTVSGVVPLNIKHSRGKFNVTSYLFQNPDFHSHPHAHDNPAADPTGKTKLLYKKPGRFSGTYQWDTRGLANGVHVLYFQTEDKSADGLHAGALKLFFNVRNDATPPPPVEEPPNTEPPVEDPPAGECP